MTSTEEIDRIEVLSNGIIQVRRATKYFDGPVLSHTKYHRWTLVPGQDVSQETQEVKAVAAQVWTVDVINNFKKSSIKV
jgi:hypothetical protein